MVTIQIRSPQAHLPHHNDANDQDDCLNSVVARKHGDDEKMTPRARARAMMKWINLFADLEGRNVCAIFNKF